MDRVALATLVAEDLTVREIAARVQRSPTNVRYWLQRHGLQTTKRARRQVVGPPGAREAGVCRHHGEVEVVVTGNGTRRCVRCRSQAVTRARRRVKARLVSETGGACVLCGYDRCASALHFHHLEPDAKRFSVGGQGLTRAIATLQEEANKCVLLCSNCHAEVEAGCRRHRSGLGGWDSNPQPLD
jgi:hypothetical protein